MFTISNARQQCRRGDGIRSAVVGLSLSILSGCSEPLPQNAIDSGPTAHSADQLNSPNQVTADVAVRQVLEGLRRQNARAVWDFLPPAHQNDVQRLLRDLAERVDETTWNRLIAVLRRTSQALRKISARPMESTDETSATDSAIVVRNPILLAKLLDLVIASDFGDVTRLRALDVGRVCETTGSDLLRLLAQFSPDSAKAEDPFAKLSQVEVRLVTASDDTAIISVRWPGQEPVEYPLVRVDNHWLPKSLAENWFTEFAAVRQRSLDWADSTSRQRDVWNTQLQTAEQWLDEVEAAPSTTAAQQRLLTGATQLLIAWLGQTNPPHESDPSAVSETATNPIRKSKVPDTEELLPDQ